MVFQIIPQNAISAKALMRDSVLTMMSLEISQPDESNHGSVKCTIERLAHQDVKCYQTDVWLHVYGLEIRAGKDK